MDIQTSSQGVLATPLPSLTFVLTQLDVYNWGAFAGRHSAQIDLDGTAIIGPTGSGKTTLVDALMTLLATNPRYNLASTGGHESDRDLVSYVRGVSGPGNNSGDNEHIARPGKTLTGISARFSNGEKQLCLAAIFWLDDSSSAAEDLKRHWIFSQAFGQDLDSWLEAQHTGGARALKQLERETPGLHVSKQKQEYLSHLRRFFEVGENAFTLLNRAAGLKQLNSIDEIFRELVLDDASAFERAAEVAREFDDLASIHSELEVARQQQHSLQPIAESWGKRERHAADLLLQRQLQVVLPIWYASVAYRLWGEHLDKIEESIGVQDRTTQSLKTQIEELSRQAETLRDVYLKAGGANIEQMREQIESQQRFVDERRRNVSDYRRLTHRLGFEDALTVESLSVNQVRALEQHTALKELLPQQKQEAWRLGVVQQRHQEELALLESELEQVKARPGSNIPGAYQQFRSELAGHLNLGEEVLPFVAELVEVRPEDSAWRGAIERAIGGNRLRVMVPPQFIEAALAWVNDRDNRLHVRLLEVEASDAPARFFEDGFTRKLTFKPHPCREGLKRFLASIDRHCVPSIEQLHAIAHSLTVQGSTSDKGGFFEKKDQRRLDQDWMTGFDNKDRLSSLAKQIIDAQGPLQSSRQSHEVAQQGVEAADHMLRLLETFTSLEFSAIDLPGAERTLDSLQIRLRALSEPDSDAEQARLQWHNVDAQLKSLREDERRSDNAKAALETNRDHAKSSQQRAFRRTGDGLTDGQRRIADQHLAVPAGEVLKDLDDIERVSAASVQDRIKTVESDLRTCEQNLVRQMGHAQRLDTGALAEAGTDIQDVPRYLERLRLLTEEALPEKLQRFLDYLNQSSDQGVTQLLSDIENEVSLIEERIEDLNRTLRRVDYQPGCYLRLEPQRVVHESLRTLQHAQRHLRSAALKDDQGESHFKALKHMVGLLRDASERRKTLGARELLDPRYRLKFAVSVIERATGIVIEVRTGSQGGSGGEKEIIASYVLTASLSYALCPDGRSQPLFGTIVLDEAFSKSSRAVAGRIISALNEFGLHPLFVTPNKELQLLRAHSRSAILIHRKGQRATMTSLSWEELEAHARQRSASHNEVSG